MRFQPVLYSVLILSSLAAYSCYAAPVKVELSAHVTGMYDSANLLGNQVSVGQVVTAKYTYDSGVQDTDASPQYGIYPQNETQSQYSIDMGSLKIESDPTPGYQPNEVDVHPSDCVGWCESMFRILYFHNKPLSEMVQVYSVFFNFDDYSGHYPVTDQILTAAPDMQQFSVRTIEISGGSDSNSFSIVLQIDSASLQTDNSVFISPSSGSFLRYQYFDAAILLPTGIEVVNLDVTDNGVQGLFSFGYNCNMSPPNAQNRPALFCANAGAQLQDGVNHLVWHLFLSDGSMMEKTVDWEMIP
ncbi:MAG TPA: hypothetical protein VG962_00775 [Steroidobacteraceae bacterium]|nr:hypothetical protein [Steroidobacteraceae bacterium]